MSRRDQGKNPQGKNPHGKNPHGKDAGGTEPRRRRALISAEDRALWNNVARSVRPLPGRTLLFEQDRDTSPDMPSASAEPVPQTLAVAPAPTIPRPPAAPPLAPLERRLKRHLARGRRDADRVLDLHGLTQERAHHALNAFIMGARADGLGLVLVVTGKGETKNGGERGVLRRLVPLWLAEPRLRPLILGFEPAARGHGGDGALYVRLRKPKPLR